MDFRDIETALAAFRNDAQATLLQRFFKTGAGQYGEGDRFLGLTSPQVRAVARQHREASLHDVEHLLQSPWHEVRACGLVILTLKMQRAKTPEQQRPIVELYLGHTPRINNWDLVDISAPHVLGHYMLTEPRDVLYSLAHSSLLWDNRIAMVSTLTLIRHNELDDCYCLATIFLNHPHDLMHKAAGWMLREAGKRDKARLVDYIEKHRLAMPRTMLRYAIEKLDDAERRHLMRRG